MRMDLPKPLLVAALTTVPGAAVRMGVPLGADISMPQWNLPRLRPKGEKTIPSTGHES